MRTPILACLMVVMALAGRQRVRAGDKKKVDEAAVQASLMQGRAFIQHGDYLKAIGAFEKADKTSHHTCASCLMELFEAQRKAGYVVDALDTAKKAVKEAGDDKALAAKAHLVRGVLLSEMATKASDKKHAEAEDEMRQAIRLNPADALAHYDLGFELMKAGRDADGIAELKTYLASNGADPRLMEKVKEMIGDPRRAREPFAPDFSFTSVEGQTISLGSLRGKVGLLDFWGTWCPPCRESIPTMVRLNKEFAGQAVEILGISSDRDEQAWRAFIAKNQMTWPEYLDSSGAMQNTFGVDSFPTYIVLNRDGVIRFRQSGFGDDTGMRLEDAIKKALKEKPETGGGATPATSSATESPSDGESNAAPANVSSGGTQGVRPSIVVTPAGANAEATPAMGEAGEAIPQQRRVGLALRVQFVSQTRSVEVAQYVQRMMRILTQHWAQTVLSEGLMSAKGTVVVQFAMGRDGSLAGTPEVAQTDADNPECNKAALDAVSAAFPFEALPKSFPDAKLELRMIFLYNEPAGSALPQMPQQNP
jgi:peroxiredoxin/outer membrane biosynthesis protein TonB